MSIRVLACCFLVFGLSLYSWRNCYVGLCASMVLMAFLQHPDMPHSFAGIQGLNAWNFLMLNVIIGWLLNRRAEGLVWDMPRRITVMALGMLFVVVWSFLRLAGDYSALNILNLSDDTVYKTRYTLGWVTSEFLINCAKWLLPGVLLYDVCRTRRRVEVALALVLLFYFLIAIQTIRRMPLSSASSNSSELNIKAAKLNREVGFYRTDISMMLAGASWAILGFTTLLKKRWQKVLAIGASGIVALGQSVTGGRAGYVTWGLLGLVLCLVRWRKLLPLIPMIVLLVCLFMPAVRDRMLAGFTNSAEGGIQGNDYVITSGRTLAWSFVIPQIFESPLIGYGRQAMITTHIYAKLLDGTDATGESFPHPHNAYLEILLDNGLIGLLLVLPIYVVSLALSFKLLVDRSDPLYSAVGGASVALLLGLMIAGMGAQHFYPVESSVPMWAAIGLMLRVWVERQRSQETGEALFGEDTGEGSEAWAGRDEDAALNELETV